MQMKLYCSRKMSQIVHVRRLQHDFHGENLVQEQLFFHFHFIYLRRVALRQRPFFKGPSKEARVRT